LHITTKSEHGRYNEKKKNTSKHRKFTNGISKEGESFLDWSKAKIKICGKCSYRCNGGERVMPLEEWLGEIVIRREKFLIRFLGHGSSDESTKHLRSGEKRRRVRCEPAMQRNIGVLKKWKNDFRIREGIEGGSTIIDKMLYTMWHPIGVISYDLTGWSDDAGMRIVNLTSIVLVMNVMRRINITNTQLTKDIVGRRRDRNISYGENRSRLRRIKIGRRNQSRTHKCIKKTSLSLNSRALVVLVGWVDRKNMVEKLIKSERAGNVCVGTKRIEKTKSVCNTFLLTFYLEKNMTTTVKSAHVDDVGGTRMRGIGGDSYDIGIELETFLMEWSHGEDESLRWNEIQKIGNTDIIGVRKSIINRTDRLAYVSVPVKSVSTIIDFNLSSFFPW
jgi:hypothetical protein